MTAPRLAYHHTEGAGPPVVFLPGYASDMTGTKALALEAWAKATKHAFVRFDYRGCGASEGEFDAASLSDWRDDARAILEQLAERPAILVGSSMGGWIALLLALGLPDRVAGIVLVAPAPDFTDWGFSQAEKITLLQDGRLERPNPYGLEPTVTTRAFWSSGEANRLPPGPIATTVPVRILQGQKDTDVPWTRSLDLAGRLGSADVHLTLIREGDHRLSREADIRALIGAVESLC